MLNKGSLSRLKVISFYTAKEAIKSKVLVNTVLLGFALLVFTYIAYSFTYGEPSRVALDFGLGTLSLSSVFIAIFMGAGLITDEVKNRTVYIIISRPVKRSVFILGKILGLSSVLIINILILSAITLSLYFGVGGNYESLISWAILFIAIEAILMLLIVSMLSLVTSKVLSVILSIMIYIVGHSIDGVKVLTFIKMRPSLGTLLDLYQYILPGFYKLNLKQHLLYDQVVESSYLYSTLLYGMLYGLSIICLSMYLFERKNLD
jgi:ABC-type transport system involved in multi-copper enzyme maturation permease subunit